MEKNLVEQASELVFASTDSQISRTISKQLSEGRLRKIAPRIYTKNLTDSPEEIIKRHAFYIIAHLFPSAVVSHRSALEGGFTTDNTLFLTYHYTKKINLPGISIRLLEGHGAQLGDNSFIGQLFYASQARAFLENMQQSRQRGSASKTLNISEIESRLERYIALYGEEQFNRLRDQARELANPLKMQTEFKKLDRLMGAILGTHTVKLTSPSAKARAKGLPYDVKRIELFAKALLKVNSYETPYQKGIDWTKETLKNFAFFVAYFSNYIEGTRFLVEEAHEIIFDHKIILHRQDDSHDILGTYQLVADEIEMKTVPSNAEELYMLLKKRHASIMIGRPDKTPGVFKNIENRAGNTVFVAPTLVKGTLAEAFSMYISLAPGIKRALFMMFLVAEVHPFLDGNGRLARIMMNAELDMAEEQRIIIPTVYREDYLLALKKLSNQQDVEPYIRMLLRAQKFTASIDFSDYETSYKQFLESNAFLEPYQGKLVF